MAKPHFDAHNKDHQLKALKFLKAFFELVEAFEITGKMFLAMPFVIVIVGGLKATDIFPDESEKALKLLFEDSNLCHQIIKKLDEHIKKLGG